jgi:hypothetical protein
MTVGGVLALICQLPPAQRDRDEVRAFVLTLPRNQNEAATSSQVKKAHTLANSP